MSAAVVSACSGGMVLTAWALHVGASPLLLGTLWALPYLAQIVQPLAACLTSRAGPKPVAVWATTLGRQMLWGLALLPLLASAPARRATLLLCFGAFAVGGVVGNNAWMSWIAVLVPARVRGRYFGPRNARALLVGTAASLAVGTYLDAARASGTIGHALAVTSAAGAAFGVLSTCLMLQQRATAAPAPLASVDARAAFAPFRDPGVRRVLAFQAAWSASTGVAASFYSAYALGGLGLGVAGFALYNTALSLLRVTATPVWGRALDRLGPRRVLVACALLSALGSGLWIATMPGSPRGHWLVALDAVVSGVALAGIDIAVFMLPLARVASVPTPAFVASTSMVAGAAFGSASVLGGAVLAALPAVPLSTAMRALFAASAMGRVVAAVFATRLGRNVCYSKGASTLWSAGPEKLEQAEESAQMQSRSRNSEAAQRFAERRRREDEAPRLRDRIPSLASLRIEVQERRGTTNAGDPKHVRLVVVDSAPALFEIPCGDHACRDGGHDLTDMVIRHLAARDGHFELEDVCHGNIGSASCGAVVHVTATATYR